MDGDWGWWWYENLPHSCQHSLKDKRKTLFSLRISFIQLCISDGCLRANHLAAVHWQKHVRDSHIKTFVSKPLTTILTWPQGLPMFEACSGHSIDRHLPLSAAAVAIELVANEWKQLDP